MTAFEGISFNAPLFLSSDEGQAKIFEELELTKLKEALESLRQAQAYLGLIDNLDWVISMTSDPANNFDAATKFVEFLVVDNLYTENFLATSSAQPGSPYRNIISREEL